MLSLRPIAQSSGLKRFRGGKVGKKLEIYVSGPDEDGVILTLTSEFRVDAKPEAIVRTFIILIAIFEACYHYARKPSNPDRILTFYNKLR